jgi:hypothetical protein
MDIFLVRIKILFVVIINDGEFGGFDSAMINHGEI